MKKRLSFLLALILVLTLAFSMLPVAGAATDPVIAEAAANLPQTGGISPSTLFSLLGLALISTGGTVFSILKKKNHSKDN